MLLNMYCPQAASVFLLYIYYKPKFIKYNILFAVCTPRFKKQLYR